MRGMLLQVEVDEWMLETDDLLEQPTVHQK